MPILMGCGGNNTAAVVRQLKEGDFKMDKIAVLIPCYNESKTIRKVVEDFKRELPEATIYVYDNNSKDGTDEIAKNAGAIVRYEKSKEKEML